MSFVEKPANAWLVRNMAASWYRSSAGSGERRDPSILPAIGRKLRTAIRSEDALGGSGPDQLDRAAGEGNAHDECAEERGSGTDPPEGRWTRKDASDDRRAEPTLVRRQRDAQEESEETGEPGPEPRLPDRLEVEGDARDRRDQTGHPEAIHDRRRIALPRTR